MDHASSILILFAHPALEKSRLNRQLIAAVNNIAGITIHDLYEAGVGVVERETFGSALSMGEQALRLFGFRAYKAQRVAQTFKAHDEGVLQEMAYLTGNEPELVARSRQMNEDLARLLQTDDQAVAPDLDHAWDTAVHRQG